MLNNSFTALVSLTLDGHNWFGLQIKILAKFLTLLLLLLLLLFAFPLRTYLVIHFLYSTKKG